jgi:peroxiredoxin
MASLPPPGTPAPDFTLPSTAGADVKMCSFTEDYSRFRDANTVVLPISVDSIPTLKEFKAKERITVDLLRDFKREVSRQYGTLLEETFFSNRAYTPNTRRQNQELLAQLEAHRRSA